MSSRIGWRAGPALGLLLLGACAARVHAADGDGRAILARVYGQDRSHTRLLRATLEVIDRDGHARTRRFVEYRSTGAGDRRTLLVFSAPAEVRGLELLSIERRAAARQQWVMPVAPRRARRVAAPDRAERFAGSDFSYEDLAEPLLEDFAYRVLDEPRTLAGHATWLVEGVPVTPERSQYGQIRYWVARDVPCILYAEMRDGTGRLVRTLTTGNLAKRAGVWGPRRIEARTVADGSRSILTVDDVRFDANLPDALFTPEAMESANPRPPTE